jgi:hypothetical protein
MFPNGGYIATGKHQNGDPQLDVFAVDNNGNITAYWVVGAGPWQGPQTITSGSLFVPGAPIAVSQQFGVSQIDVFGIDKNGVLDVFYAFGTNGWQGPVQISTSLFNTTRGWTPVVASQRFGIPSNLPQETDVFAISQPLFTNGFMTAANVVNQGRWTFSTAIP